MTYMIFKNGINYFSSGTKSMSNEIYSLSATVSRKFLEIIIYHAIHKGTKNSVTPSNPYHGFPKVHHIAIMV